MKSNVLKLQKVLALEQEPVQISLFLDIKQQKQNN
jgi:hypothetical protein